MRAVVDTNILVRAVIKPSGTVGPVLLRLRHGDYTLLYAQSLLEELIDVLNRPRIRDKYRLTDQDIQTVVSLILLRGEAVVPLESKRGADHSLPRLQGRQVFRGGRGRESRRDRQWGSGPVGTTSFRRYPRSPASRLFADVGC